MNKLTHKDWIALFSVAVLFLAYSFVVIARYPVHGDEIQSSERVANLYLGNGYTSTAQDYITSKDEFAVSNSMSYDILLYIWMHVFGLSLVGVRSFNYFLAFCITFFLWLGARRLGIIKNSELGGFYLVLVLFSTPMQLFYSFNRYDSVGILIMSMSFLAFTIENRIFRRWTLFALMFLLAFSGIQFVPYTALWGLVVLVVFGKKAWGDLVAAAIGGVLGYAAMGLILHWNDALDSYINNILFYDIQTSKLYGRWESIKRSLFNNLNNNMFLFSIVGCAVVTAFKNRKIKYLAVTGVILALSIPVYFSTIGHYSRWYAWMVFLPLSLIGIAVAQILLEKSKIGFVVFSIVIVLGYAHIPVNLLPAITEWNERNYDYVDAFVREHVDENAVVYTIPDTYYPAKQVAKQVYTDRFLDHMSDDEKDSLTHITLAKSNRQRYNIIGSDEFFEDIGGAWHVVGEYHIPRSALRLMIPPSPEESYVYDLVIYERMKRTQNSF